MIFNFVEEFDPALIVESLQFWNRFESPVNAIADDYNGSLIPAQRKRAAACVAPVKFV
jgi:hypothetical protein